MASPRYAGWVLARSDGGPRKSESRLPARTCFLRRRANRQGILVGERKVVPQFVLAVPAAGDAGVEQNHSPPPGAHRHLFAPLVGQPNRPRVWRSRSPAPTRSPTYSPRSSHPAFDSNRRVAHRRHAGTRRALCCIPGARPAGGLASLHSWAVGRESYRARPGRATVARHRDPPAVGSGAVGRGRPGTPRLTRHRP